MHLRPWFRGGPTSAAGTDCLRRIALLTKPNHTPAGPTQRQLSGRRTHPPRPAEIHLPWRDPGRRDRPPHRHRARGPRLAGPEERPRRSTTALVGTRSAGRPQGARPRTRASSARNSRAASTCATRRTSPSASTIASTRTRASTSFSACRRSARPRRARAARTRTDRPFTVLSCVRVPASWTRRMERRRTPAPDASTPSGGRP